MCSYVVGRFANQISCWVSKIPQQKITALNDFCTGGMQCFQSFIYRKHFCFFLLLPSSSSLCPSFTHSHIHVFSFSWIVFSEYLGWWYPLLSNYILERFCDFLKKFSSWIYVSNGGSPRVDFDSLQVVLTLNLPLKHKMTLRQVIHNVDVILGLFRYLYFLKYLAVFHFWPHSYNWSFFPEQFWGARNLTFQRRRLGLNGNSGGFLVHFFAF